MRTDTTSEDINEDGFMEVPYGFIMDNVAELRNLTATSNKLFSIYPDPVFLPIYETMYVQPKNDYVTINVSIECFIWCNILWFIDNITHNF